MMLPAPLLVGSLARHARGLTLSTTLGAMAGNPPESGTAIAFAKEFQADADAAATWLAWCDRPGRLLLLLPPFIKASCERPVPWEARRTDPLAGAETELGRLLARERQHELRGGLMPLDRSAGQVLSAGWRRHPLAGLLVVTALPAWSLVTLEHRATLRAWLADLYAQAGASTAPVVEEAPPVELRRAEDWPLMVHLAGGSFSSAAASLDALDDSNPLSLEPETARAALERLVRCGLVEGGALTARGEATLAASPYAAWYREIRRMRHAR